MFIFLFITPLVTNLVLVLPPMRYPRTKKAMLSIISQLRRALIFSQSVSQWEIATHASSSCCENRLHSRIILFSDFFFFPQDGSH
jgi:hypothetical protein